jgi:hypothetical protein
MTRILTIALLLAGALGELKAQTEVLQIPTSHPRLWWTPARLAQARAWYAQNPFTPSSSDRLGQAFRYLMTGETQYARSAINFALSYTVTDQAANSPDPNTGIASDGARWEGENIILIFDWCYDAMTPDERTIILNRWNTYIDNLRKKPWGGPNMPQSNYYWGYLRNELEWAIATWHENQPMAQTFLNHALITRWQNSFVPHAAGEGRGGVLQEGSAYGRALVDYATIPLVSAGLLGRNLLAETDFFREAVYAIIYSTTPGRTALKSDGSLHWELFPFADDERFVEGGDAEAVTWANFMTMAATEWSGSAVGQYARRWMSTVGYPATRYVRAVDTGGSERDFATLPLDYYASGAGFLYGRNVWGSQGTAFHLQLSETYDHGHRHEDMGNWQIWRKGRWLSRETTGYAQDIAGYAGSGSVGTEHELAHNGLLVDRRGFPRGGRNGRPVVKRVESRPTYAYAAVDITPAFRNTATRFPRPEQDNAAVARVEREYVFVRPLETLVIFDRAQSTNASTVKTFLAHFERAPAAEGNSYLAVNGDQALRVTTLLPDSATRRVVNEGGQIGQYRLEVETSGTAQSYFLHVLQAGGAADPDLQALVTDSGDRYLVTLEHPSLGSARLEFMKGAASTGGGIAYSASSLPTSLAPFLDRIQGMQVTASGPVWEGSEEPAPPEQDTTAPVISDVAASEVTHLGATVSWTTDEAADHQVEFGLTTDYGSSTPWSGALTTTHKVNVTADTAEATYHYRVRSRDAAGNLAVSDDYVFTTLPSPPPQYTIAATADAGGLVHPEGSVTLAGGAAQSFTITPHPGFRIAEVFVDGVPAGPVDAYTFSDVSANHTLRATFTAADPNRTVGITVHPFAGNGPAHLVSNAVPFKPGVLTDVRKVRVLDGEAEVPVAAKVLAVWPQDNSIRSLLLQFVVPEAPKAYVLEIGVERATVDAALLDVSWDLPQRIFVLPAAYLSESLVFWEQQPLGQTGFPAWDQKQSSDYSALATVGTAACANADQYYDAITTIYQLYARTGELRYLVDGRRWALHHRRDQIQLSGPLAGRARCAETGTTRYTYPQGLIGDYFMFGDEENKRVSGLVVNNFYRTLPDSTFYIAPGKRGFWTEREAAFALIGMLAHYQATADRALLDEIKRKIALLHGMQVANERRAWTHNLYDHDPSEGCPATAWGSSPWMSGLLLEAIIEYHKLTADPLAQESILMAVDDLRGRYIATSQHAGRSFVYLGCDQHTDGNPDLDNLVSHAYGYAYRLTGNVEYLQLGTMLFRTAVEAGWSRAHKHYNQHFRSSGRFVAYVAGAPKVETTEPPPDEVAARRTPMDDELAAAVRFDIDVVPYLTENAPPAEHKGVTAPSNSIHPTPASARDPPGNPPSGAEVEAELHRAAGTRS